MATAIKSAVSARQSWRETATLFLTPSSSRAPNRWLVLTAKPAVSPDAKPRIKKVMEPVIPTPAMASEETVCPTISVSAIL